MAVKKTGRLGRGLDNLISSSAMAEEKQPENKSGELVVNINLIDPNRLQPRKKFNEEKLRELADSIELHGVVEPLVLQKNGDRYEIIAGERRWRAARMAKLKEVPAVIKDYADREKYEVALIENIQREDLNSIEEAKAYQKLIEDNSYTQEELAIRVSKSRTAITNSMRLLKLDERVQEMVIDDMLSGGHARALLGIADPEKQYEIAGRVFEEKLSVRDTEKLVKSIANGAIEKPAAKKTLEDEAIYDEYRNKMIEIVGTKIDIQRKDNNKGKIVIDFNTAEEFEHIYEILIKGTK